MRGKSGPKANPCGTPTLKFCHFPNSPLRGTLWCLLCKKDSIRLKMLPYIPLFLSLCMDQLVLSLIKIFQNILSSKKELTYVESLKGQYDSNHILSWSEFAICAFDKNWSTFSKWTIQFKPSWLWLKVLEP